MTDPSTLLPAAITVAIFLLIGFPVHEFAHAAVAYLQGDATAKLFGRMTLNPIVHFDPARRPDDHRVGLHRRLPHRLGEADARQPGEPARPAQRRGDRRARRPGLELPDGDRRGRSCSASSRASASSSGTAGSLRVYVLYLFVLYNVTLAIFNFLPVPPLDGSTLLYRVLSPRQAWQVRPFLNQYGIFIVLGVVLLLSRPLGNLIYGVTDVLVGA